MPFEEELVNIYIYLDNHVTWVQDEDRCPFWYSPGFEVSKGHEAARI
jgi:hypothetical protein